MGSQVKFSMRHKRKRFIVDSLDFEDDLTIFANSIEIAVKQLNTFTNRHAKVGLQVPLEKTKYFTNISETANELQLEQGKILKVSKFKYTGECLEPDLSDVVSVSSKKPYL